MRKDAAEGGMHTPQHSLKQSVPGWIEEPAKWLRTSVQQPLEYVYHKYLLELLLRQKPLPPSKNGRHIPLRVWHEQPLVDERRGHTYISNSIRSARYTPWDFLPKQIFFQCTRLSNFYFICIGIPQAIPGFSTTGNYTTILPVGFFIAFEILKEGYDDWRRHRLDKVENNAHTTVLRRRNHVARQRGFRLGVEWVSELYKRVVRSSRPRWKTGLDDRSFEMRHEDEHMDADLCWTTVKWHELRVGDILKLNRNDAVPADCALLSASGEEGIAYVETMALDGETNLKSKQASPALQRCTNIAGLKNTTAEFVAEDPNRNLYDFNGSVIEDETTSALTLNEVLLRGCVLRNTQSAIGLVINTGEECKIRMNANHHPKAKKPRLERYVNRIVIALIVYVIILSVGCASGYTIWHRDYEVHAWYLNNAYVPFKQVIIGYIIMFNNVIPLALYVTLEIIKVGQVLNMHGDVGMYDEETNTPMTCNTNTILENLGQVSYVLTDKTGTLTENIMHFRGLSVAGTAWWHDPRADTALSDRAMQKSIEVPRKSIEPRKSGVKDENHAATILVSEAEVSEGSRASRSQSRPPHRPAKDDETHRPYVQGTTTQMLAHIRDHPDTIFARRAHDFLLCLALCHTALPEKTLDGTLDFQASSPDEVALVRAAQDFGLLVINRSTQSITISTTGQDGLAEIQTYTVLDVIEFSSKRKRMSIVVRFPDGHIRLLCKGADNVIISRLKHAALAVRKSHEVRRSIQIERDLHRKSEQSTPRTSFGGRPSLTIRRRSSMDIRPAPERHTLDVPSFDWSRSAARPSMTRRSTSRRSMPRQSNIFPDDRHAADNELVFSKCFRHLDDFATDGLRTLVFAQRRLSQKEYDDWKQIYQDATTALVDRQERIEAAGEVIEQELELLGASAIEDKLQKGVPETVDKLRRANMKIWMLTGDKRETAINIAHAANICQPDSEVFILDSKKGDLDGQLRRVHSDIREAIFHSVGVIDGHTLSDIEADISLLELFYSLISLIDSVICCRASPAQKASIVEGIRVRMPGLTMAIGDGANDIAMITSSHVGIGISGREGLQASRVADFSIAQFRFLQRLLLVHGRWNYIRTAKFILWTYWKEMFFYMVQACYQHYDGYTGSSLYENWSLTALNTLFTSLCVILPGIFEQDLSAETLLAVPELYTHGQQNKELNLPKFVLWMALGAAQGLLIWFVPWWLYGMHNWMGDNGTFALGDICFSLAIMWTNTKLLMLETHNKTRIVFAGFTITVAGWWGWQGLLSIAYVDNISPYDVLNGFNHGFGKDPVWWLVIIVALGILVAFEVAWKTVRRNVAVSGMWPLWKRLKRGDTATPTATAEELDLQVWQEMERDPNVRERLQILAADSWRSEEMSAASEPTRWRWKPWRRR